MAKEQFKNLTEPMFYILLSLLEENHGYGIMQQIETLTEGRVVVGPGTLYTILGKFEAEGIIEKIASGDRRKVYVITDEGRTLLDEELERLANLIADYKKVIGKPEV